MIKLKELLSEAKNPKKIDATYLDRSGKLYKIVVDGKKMYRPDFEDRYGIELPYRYDYDDMEKLAKTLKKKGITFTHNDAMDVS